MSVDNRIPSEPYIELNGVTVKLPDGRIVQIDEEQINGKEH